MRALASGCARCPCGWHDRRLLNGEETRCGGSPLFVACDSSSDFFLPQRVRGSRHRILNARHAWRRKRSKDSSSATRSGSSRRAAIASSACTSARPTSAARWSSRTGGAGRPTTISTASCARCSPTPAIRRSPSRCRSCPARPRSVTTCPPFPTRTSVSGWRWLGCAPRAPAAWPSSRTASGRRWPTTTSSTRRPPMSTRG